MTNNKTKLPIDRPSDIMGLMANVMANPAQTAEKANVIE
ncbi:hypothetical protein KT99_13222, partial [Shewanella benthica KT99]